MSPLAWCFDGAVALLMVGLAWRLLATRDAFAAVALYIAFGLVVALAWVRLGAVDVALAEAALGVGVTGALLLSTLQGLAAKRGGRQRDGSA